MDFLGPLPVSNHGNRYIIVATEYYTRFAIALATPDSTATTTASFFVNNVVCILLPKKVLTDQGAQFRSALMDRILQQFSTEALQTTPYHPQCNGLTERFNGTLVNMLCMYTDRLQKEWDRFLHMVVFAYNTSVQESTQDSPFRLMFGRDAR